MFELGFTSRSSISHSRVALTTTLLVAGVVFAPAAAGAGDYAHICRSVDGRYVMNDETLQTTDDERAGRTRSITYRIRNKVVVRKEEGYCMAGPRDGGPRARFNYAFTRYVIDIAFRRNGHDAKTSMLCELAADGLPAAYQCARRVVTIDWSLQPQQPPARSGQSTLGPKTTGPGSGTVWVHNGSTVRLTANANERQISYETPRPGLRRRGVRPGELLFEGRRDGRNYSGTAYIFTRSCGKVAYAVSGRVRNNGTRVVMTGSAPRLNASCRQVGARQDTLVFTLRP